MTKVCICKGVSKLTIKKAVQEGCDSVEQVFKKTNTGNGSCKGRRCGPKIQDIINDMIANSDEVESIG